METQNENFIRLMNKLRENPQSFIFILGSGMSQPAGLPSWETLATGLIDRYEQYKKNMGEECDSIVNALRCNTDYWSTFAELQHRLSKTEYNKYITNQLTDKNRALPESYELIWKLDICGIITYNIDKLILNAFSKTFHTSVDFATGKEAVKYKHFPVSDSKFVFFPHGEISDPSSWVFTENEKNTIYRNKDFKNVMTTLLNGKNFVIIGFNPQEYSFLSLLNDISINNTIAGYDNYYIGPNLTSGEIKRLGEYGITCINYKPEDEVHSNITNMLKTILKFVPKDLESPSIYQGKTYTEDDIPSYTECLNYGVNKLREILNGNIANILPPNTVPTDEQIDYLQQFYKKYSPQLHIAWFVDPESENGNQVHGYKLKNAVGRGAFGNVYEVYNDKNEKFALKILLPEVKDKVRYLSCFRRGIRSMNILKDHDISGMVKIHSSYEVPACIIMDYIEGITLRDAIDKKLLASINKKLELLELIASIINKAHNLQECILHRDLKPENIMLENFYYEDNSDSLNVVILDFDLSWHKGATELTVALGAMSQGFMAPEQAEENESHTRSTSVDVYSIGMISYYVLTGNNPAPYQHQFKHFTEDVYNSLKSNYKFSWNCLPQFLTETIVKATLHNQNERISLESYLSNIHLALGMILADEIPNTHPLLLRELAYEIDSTCEITSSNFNRCVMLNTSTLGKSVKLELTQWNDKPIIQIEIKKLRKGDEDRISIAKYLENAKNKALATVDKTLFYYHKGEIGVSEVTINLACKLPNMLPLSRIQQISANILDIRSRLELQ